MKYLTRDGNAVEIYERHIVRMAIAPWVRIDLGQMESVEDSIHQKPRGIKYYMEELTPFYNFKWEQEFNAF